MRIRLRPWNMAEKLLLALWLSMLAHAALLWLPLRPGQPNGGATDALTVRVRAVAAPALESAAALRERASIPAPVLAPPQSPASAPAGATQQKLSAEGDRLRLGADIYYPARELERLAEERSAITLPDVAWSGPQQPLTLLVFISETGQVDAVRFEGEAPKPLADAIAPAFHAAWYQPGIKDGRPVKSYKRIRIEPQADPAPAPALSR
ncbi:hypothetical protein [Chromobacterium sp. ASV23]|uniref:hypothetical protein n=1 Tax=Chromobacterium sp. ASV23 TaxID=2795110 RepID=UPI0018ED252E|nr:hypothetical protein [Chromobacterium sp. ASV23]